MYEPLFRRLLLPIFETVVKRRPTLALLREYEANQWLAPEALAVLQLKRLNALLEQAWSQSTFLQGWWRDHGLRPTPLAHVDELAAYPVMTKALVRAHHDRLLTRQGGSRRLTKTTGGSTGEPLRLTYTQYSFAARTALMARGYAWAGAPLGRRVLYLWGLPPGPPSFASRKLALYDRLFNRHMRNCFLMHRDNLSEYAAALDDVRPRVLIGYVAPLVSLARWILDQPEHARPRHKPDAVITAAEPLFDPQRKVIEAAFGAAAFNTYGSREFGLIGAECAHHDGLHLSVDQFVIETVDNAGRPLHGETGELLITDLSNHALPLVRYAIGDRGRMAQGPCACGRALPRLAGVEGRTLDLLRTPSGRLVPGEFIVYAMIPLAGVHQFQLIQTHLERFELRLVLRAGLHPEQRERTLTDARESIERVVGDDVTLDIQVLDELPLTATGKLRVTVSQLPVP
jgi:phenylacetate-CoA ligase